MTDPHFGAPVVSPKCRGLGTSYSMFNASGLVKSGVNSDGAWMVDGAEQSPVRPVPAVAQRLNELFARVTYLDQQGRRREYSTPAVAKAITDDPSHDTTVSRVYLATLRSGTNANPTVAVVKAIARFFDERRPAGSPPITAGYLLGEDQDEEERELRQRLEDRQVRLIAMRAAELTPAVRRQVLQMLDVLDGTRDPDHPGEPAG